MGGQEGQGSRRPAGAATLLRRPSGRGWPTSPVEVKAVEFSVMSSPRHVSAWSVARLAFEPRGWQVRFRDELREALQALAASAGQTLSARYDAPDDSQVDVENVLLYNVGMAWFGPLVGAGLTCRRGRSEDGLHRVRYEVVDAVPDPGGDAPIASLTADLGAVLPATTGQWWARLRPHAVAAGAPLDGATWFTADVVVAGPAVTGRRVANMVKPMLDGLISALHVHDGSGREILLPRLAALGAPESVWTQLVDPHAAVLGPRCLVRPFRDNVAWNPADDRCLAFRVRTRHAATWTFHAVLRAALYR
jgi:hypothetical protein